ncbi:DUF6221 family protein [Streptomyces sp. ASQP_92]|uniref:DUF6221 family protein n=1 Tax=Streptomyces sp. ASQP_92 TaxID=2979116 RepID=UPI0021BE3F35|nr:DUF6221 family protein [Streptomyces sp. ASQP_92]MCT9092817.1 DUF6221 family protein [Streptomyces sp. ASQP_92]
MDDLVQFLRDRLDEDAEAAGTATPGPWHADGGSVYATHPTDEVVSYTDSAEHIARHNPARVLADIEAKRQILDLHVAEPGQHPDFCGHDKHELPCPTLRLLALPYADHPDYREEWRP